ncbi:MAG: N-acetylmuramoyl-L-alanine amidase [Deltaproteobacteria bacterium]
MRTSGHRNRLVPATLAMLLALLGPGFAEAKGSAKPARPTSSAKVATPRSPSPALQKARAELAAVKKNPAKRRYRENWERAIRALERSARGPDTGPALLDAARARYALYRFSAVEADREAALKLAARASKAGTTQAGTLAVAIRKEAGDAPVPAAKGKKAVPPAVVTATPRKAEPAPPAVPAPAVEEDEHLDPALAEAIAELPGAPDPAAGSAAPARVSEVHSWTSSDYTRVAVYLSHAASFEKQEIPADAQHPRRLVIDLKSAVLDGSATERTVADTLLHRVRAAQLDSDTVRVVLELKGKEAFQVFTLGEPPRLIVDIGIREPREQAVARAAPRPTGDDEETEADRRPIRHVIIDAGHGGHDTGAVGPRGVKEKDVTLAMAKRLAEKLRAGGFQVTLTRTDDRYLKLEERTAIANLSRGDLFVSLHTNANPRRDRSGVETYFLNVTDDRYARRLAARENGTMELEEAPRDLQRILTDLDSKASAGASRTLARLVQKEITARTRQNQGPVRDRGVKSALFYVLLGARMPAVLVETAFISNREEEKRLSSPAYQQLVAEGVTRAVSDFAGRGRVASR